MTRVTALTVVDPKHTIRLTLAYPASTGRNFAEILRVIDSLQLGDKYKITTPAGECVRGVADGRLEEGRPCYHPPFGSG